MGVLSEPMRKKPEELYGIGIREIAERCRVSEKTADRWKSGTTCPPESALMILSGDLGCFDPAWSGWIIRGNTLYSPEGWAITRGDVLGVPLARLALENARAEARRLKDELYAGEQPLPEAWPEHKLQLA